MAFNAHFFAFTIITCLSKFVRCASDEFGSFIFPPNSTATNFTSDAPVVAKIGSVHWNDNIVIEYTLPDTVKQLWLSQDCYGALNDTNSTLIENGGGSGFSYSSTGVCK